MCSQRPQVVELSLTENPRVGGSSEARSADRRTTDKEFRLGLNAAQTTLSAVAKLAGATVDQSKR